MSASTSLLTVGLNHQTAPLDVRGRFAFSAAQLPAALSALRDRLSRLAPEVALLSTCNRTELYLAAPLSSAHAAGTLVEPTTAWLAAHGDVTARELESHLYVKVDQHAARHAFRVASGLDSMVLGETQILGQIKSAVRDATSAGLLGTTLHQLFQRSFAVAKEVRSTTEIGSHSISMAAATVRLAGELFEDLREVDVLFVGAGEMIELAATHFAARQPRSMTLANRTMARGERLASAVGAHVLALSDLPQRLHDFDVVVSCTASTLPIIGLGAVESALKQRRHRPMFMVDLAVPRDIEPEVALLRDVYLYTLDDLMAVVQQGGEKRQAAVAQAEAIIDAGVQSFTHWLDHRASVPLIQAVQQQAESWRAAEVARARKLLARGVGVEAALEALSKGLTQKLLHGAMVELNGADPEQRERSARALSRMYLRHATRDAADETPGSL